MFSFILISIEPIIPRLPLLPPRLPPLLLLILPLHLHHHRQPELGHQFCQLWSCLKDCLSRV